MKIVMVDRWGNETLVCESIDRFHGMIFVSLMNGNYSSKVRNVQYRLVELDHEMEGKCNN